MTKKVDVTRDGLHDIANDVIDLVLAKNADYGDAWQRQGMAGVAVRLADKLCRVDNLIDGTWMSGIGIEILIVDEAVEDTLIDAIGYCLLGMLYLRAHQDQADG